MPAPVEISTVYTATESDTEVGGLPSGNGNRYGGSLVFGLRSHIREIVEREASARTVTSSITFILGGTHSSDRECRGECCLQAAICQTAIVGGARGWSQLVGSKLVVPAEIRLARDTSPVDHSTSNVVGQIQFRVSGGLGNPQGFQGKDLSRSKAMILQGQVGAICNEADG